MHLGKEPRLAEAGDAWGNSDGDQCTRPDLASNFSRPMASDSKMTGEPQTTAAPQATAAYTTAADSKMQAAWTTAMLPKTTATGALGTTQPSGDGVDDRRRQDRTRATATTWRAGRAALAGERLEFFCVGRTAGHSAPRPRSTGRAWPSLQRMEAASRRPRCLPCRTSTVPHTPPVP